MITCFASLEPTMFHFVYSSKDMNWKAGECWYDESHIWLLSDMLVDMLHNAKQKSDFISVVL